MSRVPRQLQQRGLFRSAPASPRRYQPPLRRPRLLDPLEQRRSRLVLAAREARQLRLGGNQLAAKRLGQDRLRQLLCPRGDRSDALLDRVSEREERLDAANDLPLL